MAILYEQSEAKHIKQSVKNNVKRTKNKRGVEISSQCLVDYMLQHHLKVENFKLLTGLSNDTNNYLFKNAEDIVFCNKTVVEKIIMGLYVGMTAEYQIDLKKLMPRLWLDCKMHRWDKKIQKLLIYKSKEITLLDVVKNNH